METGKVTSWYASNEKLEKLDRLRGSVRRSVALNRILDYILSQNDDWVQDLLGSRPQEEQAPSCYQQ